MHHPKPGFDYEGSDLMYRKRPALVTGLLWRPAQMYMDGFENVVLLKKTKNKIKSVHTDYSVEDPSVRTDGIVIVYENISAHMVFWKICCFVHTMVKISPC